VCPQDTGDIGAGRDIGRKEYVMKIADPSPSRMIFVLLSRERRALSRRLFPFILYGVILLGLMGVAAICVAEDGGSGAPGYAVHREAPVTNAGSVTSPQATIVGRYNVNAQVLVNSHGSEIGGLSTGQAAIYKFQVHTFSDIVGHVDPEAFTVTVVDLGRSGETIRIRVSKLGTAGTVSRSAVSPNSASCGLAVKDGDIVRVVVDYPKGFLYGNTNSAYVIQWALQNTGWIVSQ
jgi:hypothetical protein